MRWFVTEKEWRAWQAEARASVQERGPFVDHLREEVAFWRAQFEHERQRAEVAIDQCRAMHQGIGPVSLPPRAETARAEAQVAAMFRDPEMAAMGMSEGVG